MSTFVVLSPSSLLTLPNVVMLLVFSWLPYEMFPNLFITKWFTSLVYLHKTFLRQALLKRDLWQCKTRELINLEEHQSFINVKDQLLFTKGTFSGLSRLVYGKPAFKIANSWGNFAEIHGMNRFFTYGVVNYKSGRFDKKLFAIEGDELRCYGQGPQLVTTSSNSSGHGNILAIWKDTLLIRRQRNHLSFEDATFEDATKQKQKPVNHNNKVFKLNRMGTPQPMQFCFSEDVLVVWERKYLSVFHWQDKKWKHEKKQKLPLPKRGIHELVMITSRIFVLLCYFYPHVNDTYMAMYSIENTRESYGSYGSYELSSDIRIRLVGEYHFFNNNPRNDDHMGRMMACSQVLLPLGFFLVADLVNSKPNEFRVRLHLINVLDGQETIVENNTPCQLPPFGKMDDDIDEYDTIVVQPSNHGFAVLLARYASRTAEWCLFQHTLLRF